MTTTLLVAEVELDKSPLWWIKLATTNDTVNHTYTIPYSTINVKGVI